MTDAASVTDRLCALYADRESEVDLAALLADLGDLDDDALADLIEVDGRRRAESGRTVLLDRYLRAIPDLEQRTVALDAAIDVALRALDTSGDFTAAVERLVQQHPHFEETIREAAVLTNAICSTAGLRERVRAPRRRELPTPFGPPLPDARQRYELRELLGEGAFGQVYLAVDRQLSEADHEALVAIKVLSTPDESPWARQRLIEEATKARRIEHPNVVRVLDRGVSGDDEDYIVSEYVDGGDLAAWFRRTDKPIPIRDAVLLMAHIARGVRAAHAAGLVHCDLKPGNIMLSASGEPKVADFGVAVRRGESIERLGLEAGGDEHPIGNIAFIAPEQYRMEPDALNTASDIYALGGILFLILTQQLPNGETVEEIAATHDRERGRTDAPRLRPIRHEIDRDLEAVCRRALAPDPADRYDSAGELAGDLERWMRLEPITWTRPGPWRVLRLWTRRRPAVALLLLALIAASITGVLLWIKAAQNAAIEGSLRNIMLQVVGPRLQEGKHIADEMLGSMWLLEELYGPRVIDDSVSVERLRAFRIEFAQRLIDQAEREKRRQTLDTLLWETALAYWLVQDRRPVEGLSVLEQNRSGWSAIGLSPDDDWWRDLDAIEACAVAQSTLSDAAATGADDLAAIVARLEAHNKRYEETAFRGRVRFMVVDTLIELYGESGVDDADRLQAARALRAFLSSSEPAPATTPLDPGP